jgi:hypothetical protein
LKQALLAKPAKTKGIQKAFSDALMFCHHLLICFWWRREYFIGAMQFLAVNHAETAEAQSID